MIEGALAGLAIGGVYAVIAVCLTLMNRLARVINFAQAAVGMFAAFLAASVSQLGIPDAASIVIGLIVGTLLSGSIGFVLWLWMPEASIASRSAVTVAALLAILALTYIIFGTEPLNFTVLITGAAFTVGGVVIGWITVVMVGVAVAVAVAATGVINGTRLGVQLRAVADRPIAAELVGVRVGLLMQVVWLTVGLVVSAVIIIVAPAQTSDPFSLSMLIVSAAAAALLGGFRRLDVALVGGLALGMIQGVIAQFGEWILLREWLPLVVVVVVLLWTQRKEVWDAAR